MTPAPETGFAMSPLRRALELLCRSRNPPHDPTVRPVDVAGLFAGELDLRDVDLRGAYLAGLVAAGVRLPADPGALDGATLVGADLRSAEELDVRALRGADLRGAELPVGMDASDALCEIGTARGWALWSGLSSALATLPGGRIAAGSGTGLVVLIDAFTGRALQTLEGHTGGVLSVCALGADRIVSGGTDGTVRVWDAASGRALQTLEGHPGGVGSVCALGADRIVSGGTEGTARSWMWQEAQGDRLCLVTRQCGAVTVALSADGGLLLSLASTSFRTASRDGAVVPADPRIDAIVCLRVGDNRSEESADAPVFTVPIHATARSPDGPWQWIGADRSAILVHWPHDPEDRRRTMAPWFGQPVRGEPGS